MLKISGMCRALSPATIMPAIPVRTRRRRSSNPAVALGLEVEDLVEDRLRCGTHGAHAILDDLAGFFKVDPAASA